MRTVNDYELGFRYNIYLRADAKYWVLVTPMNLGDVNDDNVIEYTLGSMQEAMALVGGARVR